MNRGLGVVVSLEGSMQSAKVLQCGKCLGYQAFYEYLLPGAGFWVGVWVGSIVQIYTMKLANYTVSEVTLVSDSSDSQNLSWNQGYPGTKRGYWWVIAWGDHLATQSEVHRSAPSTASSGSLLEMQVSLQTYYTRIPRWFVCIIEFEKCWSTPTDSSTSLNSTFNEHPRCPRHCAEYYGY